MRLRADCLLLLLLAVGLTTSLPGRRKRRDAKAIEQGSNWFKSFYNMFSEASSKSQPTSMLGITPGGGIGKKPADTPVSGKPTEQENQAAAVDQNKQEGQESQAQKAEDTASKIVPSGMPVKPKLNVQSFFPGQAQALTQGKQPEAAKSPPGNLKPETALPTLALDQNQPNSFGNKVGADLSSSGIKTPPQQVKPRPAQPPLSDGSTKTNEILRGQDSYGSRPGNQNFPEFSNFPFKSQGGYQLDPNNMRPDFPGYNQGPPHAPQNNYEHSVIPTYEYDPHTQTYHMGSDGSSPFFNDYQMFQHQPIESIDDFMNSHSGLENALNSMVDNQMGFNSRDGPSFQSQPETIDAFMNSPAGMVNTDAILQNHQPEMLPSLQPEMLPSLQPEMLPSLHSGFQDHVQPDLGISGDLESYNFSLPLAVDPIPDDLASAELDLQAAVPNLEMYSAVEDASLPAVKKGDAVFKDYNSLIPNKQPNPGIPNKQEEEIVNMDEDDIGFSFEGPAFRLPKEECLTQSGGVGECLQAFECGLDGGRPDGLCHLGHDAYFHLRVCCLYESYCGYETNKEVTYLKNPDFPKYTESSGDCMFKIDLLPNVCQVRLDFLELEMKPMQDGECDPKNSLHISSTAHDAFIPVKQLCGTIHREVEDELRTDLPHMYIHINRDEPALLGRPGSELPNKDEEAPAVSLNLKVNGFASRWNIRISQIQCDGANLQAPAGCGQYYNMNSGNITSFNLLDKAYPKNMSMTSCIKRDPTACALELNMKSFSVGDTKGGSGKLGYGLTCKDYFMVNGEKTSICGSNNNIPRRMIFPAHGPESVHFSSDHIHDPKVEIGYHFEYHHHSNCKDLEFFKYPNKK